MLITLPIIGTIRPRPLRALWRAWLWITAPKSSRRDWRKGLQIRSMDDAHLLNAYHKVWLVPYDSREEMRRSLFLEVQRRGLPFDRKPQWLLTRNEMFPDKRRMRLAEIMLKP